MKLIAGIILIIVLGAAGMVMLQKSSSDENRLPYENNSQEQKVSLSPTAQPSQSEISTITPSVATATKGAEAMNQPKQYKDPPAKTIDDNKTYTAVITTSKGVMTIQLFPKDAPNTVNNFVFLSREGFYTNTPFHRIIKGFMIQGGDPTGTGRGGPGYQFADEPILKSYTRGTIAMANAGPNTNGSQFFVMHQDYGLPKNYVIFGKIDEKDTTSLATLDAIATTPVTASETGEPSKPMEEILVKSIEISEK